MTERRNDGYDLARALGCEVQFFKGEVCWCSSHHLEHIPPRDDSLDDLFAVVDKEWPGAWVMFIPDAPGFIDVQLVTRIYQRQDFAGTGPTYAAALFEAVMAALETQKGAGE